MTRRAISEHVFRGARLPDPGLLTLIFSLGGIPSSELPPSPYARFGATIYSAFSPRFMLTCCQNGSSALSSRE